MTIRTPSVSFGRSLPALLVTPLLLLALAPAPAGARQTAQEAPGYNHTHVPGVGPLEPDPAAGSNSVKMAHLREDDRRKHLLADTAKLLQLSTELKDELDKTTKDQLSLDVVRKAAEIEKLAHDVKERMKS